MARHRPNKRLESSQRYHIATTRTLINKYPKIIHMRLTTNETFSRDLSGRMLYAMAQTWLLTSSFDWVPCAPLQEAVNLLQVVKLQDTCSSAIVS